MVSWSPTITQNNWYHVVFTYNNGALALYLNGSLVSSQGQTQGSATGRQFDIGFSTSSPEYWNGLIDEVRFSSTARSADWIAAEYNNQSNPSTFYSAAPVYLPIISSLSPTSGSVATSVTISGTNFGTTQGSSTVTFNGVAATPTNWSDNSIAVPVPSGAASGNVVVTVNSIASNAIWFTVPGTLAYGYGYQRAITIGHTHVPNTDQANFPVLISGTYSYLATTSNGGSVTNSNGYDIMFTSDSAGENKLNFEQDSYNPSTGAVNYWVKVPTLSHTTDTVIYMFYGNSSITASQANAAATWDANYKGVWHLNEGTGSTANDSTLNANGGSWAGNGSNHYTTGNVETYAGNFDGSTNRVTVPNSASLDISGSGSAVALEAWIYPTASSGAYIIRKGYEGGNASEWGLGVDTSGSNLYVFFRTVAGLGRSQYASSAPLALNTWYHVVATAVYGATNPTIYVNGASQTLTISDGSASTYNFPSTSNPVNIGASSDGTGYFHGLIDDAHISSIARSSDWIATEYSNQSNPAAFYTVGGANPPIVSSVSPTSGSAGTAVTITGSYFGATQGSSVVTFNGTAATPSAWSDESITVPVPTGAATGNVVVTVNGTAMTVNSEPSNAVSFTVPPPSITSLTPNSGPVGTLVAINGTAFGTPQGTSTVTFNGTTLAPVNWSDTEITIRIPMGASSGNVVVTVTGTSTSGVSFTVLPGTGTTTLTDSMGRTTTYGYQDIDGRNFMTAITGTGCASCGGRGNTALTYDELGNVQSSTDALSHTTSNTYDDRGNVLTKSQQLNTNTTLTWTYTYNSLQEVLTATDPAGNTTSNTYDTHGNLLTTTTPPPGSSGSGFTTTFQYDSGGKGELTQVTDPNGNSTTLAYTTTGGTAPAGLVASITDAQNHTTTFTYDARGNRLTSVDALNHTTTYAYDNMNRLTRITAPDTTYTQFGYDYRGRRTSVTDANGKTTAYQYDDADRLVAVTDASQNPTVYGYDTEGNMVNITDAATHETQFDYDALGRVTLVTFPSTLTEGYTYDAMNNLLTKTDRKQQTINYGYDALYRLTSKTYPDQTAVNYTYDPVSRLTQVTDPTGQAHSAIALFSGKRALHPSPNLEHDVR